MRRKVVRTLLDIRLHDAAMGNDLEGVRQAIAEGADVNSPDEEHYITPLLWACIFGSPEIVDFLLQYGADVNYADENMGTPLGDAISRGNIEIVRLLVKHGARLEVLDGCGLTPLEAAVAYETASIEQRQAIVKELIIAGASLNDRNSVRNGQTPLLVAVEVAAQSGKLEMVQWLIQHGANPKAKDDNGDGVFEYAEGGGGEQVNAVLRFLRTLT